ncbi:glutamine--fructose-6-phosphate transaminase (isomerizing) [Myxococcota bacterium]|nr:glutamine--fructose-6-phosphate transaminase (isomerizing) [Myxococcota bacterium]
MCGIVAATGIDNVIPMLMEGLQKLEYRGYDSSGIAFFENQKISIVKEVGKLSRLVELLKTTPASSTTGIGHTRWATHGKPSRTNSHPHFYEGVAVIHNGIIENYAELKGKLTAQGHIFTSQTDTEVISHLISGALKSGLAPLEAVSKALSQCKGTWALAILIQGHEKQIWLARKGSPLFIGVGHRFHLVASDVPALLPFTQKILPLQDHELAEITCDELKLYSSDLQVVTRSFKTFAYNPMMAEKEGYKHYMLKEIFEQPRAVYNTITAYLHHDDYTVNIPGIPSDFPIPEKIFIVACGTSYYAGLIGKFYLEQAARIPVEVEVASEFRYRDPLVDSRHLVIAISQSGETADTLAAISIAKQKGARILAITNSVHSQIQQVSDATLETIAGPEIGVASTKAFTTQLIALSILSLYFAQRKGLTEVVSEWIDALFDCPSQMHHILNQAPQIQVMARRYAHATHFLYLGRGNLYPIALEGALKLKEISYIHAEGYPAGEMKHGPIALIDEDLPTVVLAVQNAQYEKIMSNLEEVLSRNAKVLAVASSSDHHIGTMVNDLALIPSQIHEMIQPILCILPLQLLAYHIADFKGTDVDQPRNLAKSVTVE